ncbi:MAG: hypothetical protein KAI14_04815 [Dehalococcoidales bacterium]|nr:hypothetical protein [Dehalococcoidales bacterium]
MLKVRLIAAICLLLVSFLAGSCAPVKDFDYHLSGIVAPYRFSLIGWELQALSYEIDDLFFGDDEGTVADSEVVLEYFDIVAQVNTTERRIDAVAAGLEMGDLVSLKAQLGALEEQKKALEDKAERILEKQIGATLADIGIFNPLDGLLSLEVGFPPLNFSLESPPHLLVVSPRDRITRMREVILVPDITLDEREAIENAVDDLGVSSLVLGLGGIATYPSFISSNAGLVFTINTAIEEWLHQYLFFRPLGFYYGLFLAGILTDNEIAVMNETTVGIASQEIGAVVFQNYYSQYQNQTIQNEAASPEFDFNEEMRQIRRTVDELLANGEVEEAEAFMEGKRLFLASNGYIIRKLNQAFFAFFGTYADSPTSIDPIGNEIRTVREQSGSVVDFLNKMAAMDSRTDLAGSLE